MTFICIFLSFLTFMLPLTSNASDMPELNRENLKKYFFVDEWRLAKQFSEKKFVLINNPRSDEIAIFDNKDLMGEPAFIIKGLKIYPFSKDKKTDPIFKDPIGTCISYMHFYKRRVRKWLSCETTPCKIIESSKESEVALFDPYTNFWYIEADYKEKPSCPFAPPLEVYFEDAEQQITGKSLIFLKPIQLTSSYASFTMNEKLYYLDIRQFSREVNDNKKYLIDHWTTPLSLSNWEKRWNEMKQLNVSQRSYLEPFFAKLKTCLKKQDVRCLEKLSFSRDEALEGDPGIYKGKFVPVKWSVSNMLELEACLNSSVSLKASYTILIGNQKKCVISSLEENTYKVFTINYHEGFYRGDMGNFNFEVEK